MSTPRPTISRPSPGSETDSDRKQIRLLLADDHSLVRAGIRALLERIDEVDVIGEAADGVEALELIKKYSPDVVLLDLSMPKLSGLEVIKEVAKSFPHVRVIMLTVHETEEYAVRALRSGAAGFLPKSAASAELEVAIKTVARGEDYLSPEISQQAILKYLKAPLAGSQLADITDRQLEVLKMIAAGQSTKMIAQHLNLSVKTVETHRAQLMERLNIHDVAGLVRYAIKMGFVNIDE
jgi:DNA-binding NarL/FixJ family response regulator